MKKGLYILAALALAFSSCLRDVDTPSGTEADGEFTFAVNIPGAGYITRSMSGYDDNTAANKNLLINNMWVMVFDEAGYLSRHQAYQSGGAARFAVKLPLSDKPRILHFVCNYDWSGFDDGAMAMLNEATVMTGMTRKWSDESQPIPILYWSRLALPSGISDGINLGGGTITLKRNVAQVSVNNNSKAGADMDPDDEVVSYLTQVEFSIGNYLDRGTATGFDNTLRPTDPDYTEKLFEGVYEAPSAVPVPLADGDDGKFVYGTSSSEGIPGSSLFTYERNNADPTVADHLYILIKGLYHADESAAPVSRYYKVDIVVEGDTELQDVIRNKHYILTLNQVLSEGYATIQEAVDALALNNIATSVMQSYNSISDGTAILNIEYVNKTFVKARNSSLSNDFAIRYSYIPDATSGATDNSGVQMEWGPHSGDDGYTYRAADQMDALPNNKILLGYDGSGHGIYPSGYGGEYVDRVSGRFVASLPSSGVYTSWIKISKSNLSRTINLRLRQPYEFEPMTLTPSEVPNKSGEEVAVTFNVPETLADQLPFVVYIYAEMLAPDYKKSNIYNDDSEGVFRYRYTVRSTGTQTLHFLTGSTIGQGYVTLESELFRDASRYLSRPNDNFAAITITGVSPDGSSLAPETGLPVRVSLSVPSGFIAGDKLYIHTGLLEPAGANSTSDGRPIYKNDPSDNFYTYEPSGGGARSLWVDFRTAANISAEQISVSSEHLQTAYYDRSNYYYDFGASFVRTGDKLAITFNLYNRTSPLTPRELDIYIHTQNLQPDSEYGDQGITETDFGGAGVRWLVYTATINAASESRTVYLEPVGAVSPETIMLGSEQYNTVNYQYQ